MATVVFVDTNVFVYARDPSHPLKQAIASEWIDRLCDDVAGRTSIQTVNECYFTLTRKMRPPLRPEDAWDYVGTMMRWNPRSLDAQVILHAREIEVRYRLNWWDCLIVASAEVQGCGVLLTEDLQDCALYGNVRVQNPFALMVSDVERAAVYDPARTRRPTRYGC